MSVWYVTDDKKYFSAVGSQRSIFVGGKNGQNTVYQP